MTVLWAHLLVADCRSMHSAHPVILYTDEYAVQVNGPSVYKNYLAAAKNLGLSEGASGYWALHIKEDERHGRQMVEDVALPLIDM